MFGELAEEAEELLLVTFDIVVAAVVVVDEEGDAIEFVVVGCIKLFVFEETTLGVIDTIWFIFVLDGKDKDCVFMIIIAGGAELPIVEEDDELLLRIWLFWDKIWLLIIFWIRDNFSL
jgi:hypothetical protein